MNQPTTNLTHQELMSLMDGFVGQQEWAIENVSKDPEALALLRAFEKNSTVLGFVNSCTNATDPEAILIRLYWAFMGGWYAARTSEWNGKPDGRKKLEVQYQ